MHEAPLAVEEETTNIPNNFKQPNTNINTRLFDFGACRRIRYFFKKSILFLKKYQKTIFRIMLL